MQTKSCEKRKMRYVLHKIYELPFENQVMSYKLGILAVRAFSYLGYIKHEHRQLLSKSCLCKIHRKNLCWGLLVIKVSIWRTSLKVCFRINCRYFYFNFISIFYFIERPIFYMELRRGMWEEGVISQVWYRFWQWKI